MKNTCQPQIARGAVGGSGPDDGALVAVLASAGRLEAGLEATLGTVGLSLSKFDALDQLIMAGEPLTLGELAERLHCVRSNVTQLVDRLEVEQLVARAACPEDRRAIRASVTPIGRERHAAGVTAIRAVQSDLAGRLDANGRVELVRLLDAIVG